MTDSTLKRVCCNRAFSRLVVGVLSAGLLSMIAIGCTQVESQTQADNGQSVAQASGSQNSAAQAQVKAVDEQPAIASSSEVDPADACILNDCENPAPRLLTAEEIDTIAGELSSDETLIQDQSFALTLPMIGRADFIATETNNKKLSLRLRVAPDEYEFIHQSSQWRLWDVKAVAFQDIHQDGDGPDIIVMAEYVTGIGPTGAEPFPIAHVLFNRGDDSFQHDWAVEQALSDRNASTVAETIEIAQAEGLVRGLQYREGPP